MSCLVSKRIVNPRYKKIAPDTHFRLYHPDFGIYPKKDYFVDVDCGRCVNCFKKYMSSWRFRLIHELTNLSYDQLSRSYFVTLTIEPRFYSESKKALTVMVRRFLERARRKYKKSIRHFLITERGDKFNRLHFHGFFIDTLVPPSEFYNLWYYGFVTVSPLFADSEPLLKRIAYCTSYVAKGKKGRLDLVVAPEDFPLVLVSPGLGASYVDKNKDVHHQSDFLFPLAFEPTGSVRSLPRYLRSKVFNEGELELLKNDYFDNLSDDVVPDGPYFVGNKQVDDYTTYLRECDRVKRIYNSIYGK